MTWVREKEFLPEVLRILTRAGHRVWVEPGGVPYRRSWRDDPASLVRGSKFRPDLVVEKDDKFVIVEVKSRLILLGDVMRAREYADYFDTPVVICVPDAAFAHIPSSVIAFSSDRNIRVSALREIETTVEDLLH